MDNKKYDFIVFGASGFTGQFVVEELCRVLKDKEGVSYAIAGRSKKKLEDVLTKAKENTDLDFSNVDVIIADVNDHDSLVSMAKVTNVLLNCVGPYRFHGVKVVEACIEGKADYVDISGEPQFLEEVQWKYSQKAKESGVHIIGSCGFDSIPADMGVIFMRNNFGGDVNSIEAIVGFQDDSQGSSSINVATLESALHGYSSRKELGKIRKELFASFLPTSPYIEPKRKTLWWSDEANRWCVPNLSSDRSVVVRTQHLNFALRNKRPVQFNVFFGMKTLWSALQSIMFGLVFAVMASFEFTRNLFVRYPAFFSFGLFTRDGPKRENLKGIKFLLTFVGKGWNTSFQHPEEQHPEPPNVKKVAQVTGPDPGYFGTAIILTQCALTVREEKDNLPSRGGVYTPGSAFYNTNLLDRLQKNGIEMKMVE